ncbi:MAG: HAMP domain-containing sensor histidine kinase [Minicystis sp.]
MSSGRLAYPSFVAEMALPQNRRKLRVSVKAGYATALVFALILVAAHRAGFVQAAWALYAIVGFKLCTNALAHLSLRRERFLLEAGGLNVTADLLAMTAAVYFTGGHASPLVAMYAIEISVVALLTNLGVTLIVAASAFVFYGTMISLIYAGVLPVIQSPLATAGGLTLGYVATDLALVAVLLGVPTIHTAAILKILGEKERALEARNRDLIEAGREKSQFMANITHELRTPIHGISGLCDLVESGIYGPVSDKQRQAQRTIKQSARSLLQLIDDLLELARSDAGKQKLTPTEVDLRELLPTVVTTARWMQGTSERQITLDVEDGLPVIVSDRGKVNQIALNLLSNAVKFTQEGGKIALRARQVDGAIALEVEDDGIGISEAELARVFEAFHQADGSAERQYGGAGLGLALVRRLCALLGGEVKVKSEPGKGSTFTVTLPLQARDEAA